MSRCETCKYRVDGRCFNDHIAEELGQLNEVRQDMLIYGYAESGSFYVGPKFGCVHHTPIEGESRDTR